MSSQVDSLERGVGGFDAVCAHWREALSNNGTNCLAFVSLTNSLRDVVREPLIRHAALSSICAMLNRDFTKSGWLFTVDGNGRVDSEFVLSHQLRSTISNMLVD